MVAEEAAYTSFYTAADYPIKKVLRDPIYVQISLVERSDPNIVLKLGHCWATLSPNPQSLPQWDLLVDGYEVTHHSTVKICSSVMTKNTLVLGVPTMGTTTPPEWCLWTPPQDLSSLRTTNASSSKCLLLWIEKPTVFSRTWYDWLYYGLNYNKWYSVP